MVNDSITVVMDPLALANRLRPVLLKLNRELRRETRTLGVTAGQAALLNLIHQNPGVGVRDLAERERISAPGMSGHVDRLEAAGFVVRTRSGDDRRRVGLTLTPEGVRTLRAIRRRRTAWLAARLQGLDAREIDAVDAAVEPLARLLEVTA